jgi:hypothetical protein
MIPILKTRFCRVPPLHPELFLSPSSYLSSHLFSLLGRVRRQGLKRAYRVLFDIAEEWTTLMADDILVNSRFTAETFKSTFR